MLNQKQSHGMWRGNSHLPFIHYFHLAWYFLDPDERQGTEISLRMFPCPSIGKEFKACEQTYFLYKSHFNCADAGTLGNAHTKAYGSSLQCGDSTMSGQGNAHSVWHLLTGTRTRTWVLYALICQQAMETSLAQGRGL